MKEEKYTAIRLSNSLKQELGDLAKAERRSLAAQSALILELGLKEWRRREADRQAILSGRTQIDAAAFAETLDRR